MSLAKELEKIKFDKRLLNWHVSRGKLSKEDLKKYLDSLPDLASNVEQLSLGASGDSDSFGQAPAAQTSNTGGGGGFGGF